MQIQLFNTLGRVKQEFKPIKRKKVLFYHCGPTVYWTQHIGNLRGMTMGDLVRRVFEYNGFKVKHVRNYTDVGHLVSDEDEGEDKMAKGAAREGLSPDEIADKYIKIFERDVAALNLLEPTYKPRATELIKPMQKMVKVLLDKSFAYSTDLAIYFDISKVKDYTRLSGQKLEENISGAGKGEVSDPGKKNTADFALWFFKAGAHEKALQTWLSPFESSLVKNGEGFPGWHLECSVMAKKLLGDTIDIHMGGIEHIPVHHTNEIAQSEAANGKDYVHYWLHNGHLLADDKKMAKSEGTGYSLQEVLDRGFDPLALRYFFLGAHYRGEQNFTWEALEGAQNALNNLRDLARDFDKPNKGSKEYEEKFLERVNNDLDLPGALAIVWALVADTKVKSSARAASLLKFDQVLGLNLDQYVAKPLKVSDEVKKLLAEREQARTDKNFDLSDKLRDQIEELGFLVEDTAEGAKLRQKH